MGKDGLILASLAPWFPLPPVLFFPYPCVMQVRFLVAGDGAKRVRLEEMRDKHALHSRVSMLGAVAHSDVRSVLVKGHIFLNWCVLALTTAILIPHRQEPSCFAFNLGNLLSSLRHILDTQSSILEHCQSQSMSFSCAHAALSQRPSALPSWKLRAAGSWSSVRVWGVYLR